MWVAGVKNPPSTMGAWVRLTVRDRASRADPADPPEPVRPAAGEIGGLLVRPMSDSVQGAKLYICVVSPSLSAVCPSLFSLPWTSTCRTRRARSPSASGSQRRAMLATKASAAATAPVSSDVVDEYTARTLRGPPAPCSNWFVGFEYDNVLD